MTAIYDTPARPWAFGPLIGTDIVTRQTEALVQRYDLRGALNAGGRERRDLVRRSQPDERLVEAMVRQLVPWVDYIPDAADGDDAWPIPQGVRIETLCHSPWLDAVRAGDGTIGGKRVFRPPATPEDFAHDFRTCAGFTAARDPAIRDGFRISPVAVGEVAMEIRRDATAPTRSFLLLAAHHFAAASAADKRLRRPHPALQDCGFHGPAIVAFERLAELKRAGCIVREVERHAHAGAVLRPLLEAATDPAFIAKVGGPMDGVAWSQDIADALAADPTLLTLCHYLAVSTPALASWFNAAKAGRGTFHAGFRSAGALGHGMIEADIADAVAGVVDVRTALLSAFRDAPEHGVGSRQSSLGNDVLFKWYGLTGANDNLAAALLADFASARPGGRPVKGTPVKARGDDVRNALAEIASHLGRDGRPVGTDPSGEATNTGKDAVAAVRAGAGLSKLSLPARLSPGAGARADETMWRDFDRDLGLWLFLQDPDETRLRALRLRPADEDRLRSALRDLQRLMVSAAPTAPSKLTAHVAADLATGVSALTVNPYFADAILQLAKANLTLVEDARINTPDMSDRRKQVRAEMERRGFGGALGERHIFGIEGFTKNLLGRRPS